MSSFSNVLLTGVWIILSLIGTGKPHPLISSGMASPDECFSKSAFSFFWEPASQPYKPKLEQPPEQVSIASLLENGADYHQRLVAVRGRVTQPELHLNESEMFFNFVFRLQNADQSVVVFGRHDRTQGAPPISLDLSVEVIGVFWKTRILQESSVANTIEAISVSPFPSLIPESA